MNAPLQKCGASIGPDRAFSEALLGLSSRGRDAVAAEVLRLGGPTSIVGEVT